MKTMSAGFKAHHALGTTTITDLVKVTRTDGTVVTFTAHDQQIEYPVSSGVIYVPTYSYTLSDIENGSALSPDNLELQGFLGNPGVTEDDLKSGLWDYAAVEIRSVNYANLAQGDYMLRKGKMGDLRGGGSKVEIEGRGLMQALSRTIIRLMAKECDADLGDARCGVNVATFTVTGTVTSALSNNRQFTDPARTEATDWFTAGKITFTSGLNDGLSMEVKRSTAGGVIELHEQMPFEIVLGDTYSMYAGCTKRLEEDCRDKFNNVVNDRGFDDLPLQDVYKGPSS